MIVVTGSLAFDRVMNFPGFFKDQILSDKIHILNLSFLTDKLRKNYGGTAANIAYNMACLGFKPAILATAGKDFSFYNKFLKKAGVDTGFIKIIKTDYTSNYFAIVDKLDNQIGGFYSGAMSKADSLSLETVKPKPDFVIISPTKPEAMVKFSCQCQELKAPYMFDPGMQLPRLDKKDLLPGIKKASVLIGNDYEMSLILKKTGLSKKKLFGINPSLVLITTLSLKGSLIETKNKKIKIRAVKVKALDPVGAGDAYRAGFTAGFLSKFDLKVCGQMGSLTASYTVAKKGTTTHKFNRKSFLEKYKIEFGQKLIF
jgi:adenosine kinase